MNDIPPGWKLERVPPPEQWKLPKTDLFRANYDRIFGKKDDVESALVDDDPSLAEPDAS